MIRLRQILAIARLTVLENLRKQVLQVALLLTLAAIASTSLLSFFELGVQVKILKDLSLASILFCGGILAIALTVGSIPGELDNRTAHPVLARSLRRSDWIIAKYLGNTSTCLMCMVILGVVFLGMLAMYEKTFNSTVMQGMMFVGLEVAVIAAIGTFFSIFTSPMVAGTLTLGVFIMGQIKVSYLHGAVERAADPISQVLLTGFYHAIPNLDVFSFKDALVHEITVPLTYMLVVAIYGFVYLSFAVAASGMIFDRREL